MRAGQGDPAALAVLAWTWGAAALVVAGCGAALVLLIRGADPDALAQVSDGLIGAAAVLGLAAGVAIPLALAAAVALDQVLPRGPWVERLGHALHILDGVPPIVHGLVGALWLGQGGGLVGASLVMGVLAVPALARGYREALGRVEALERLAAYALGATPLQVMLYVVRPSAFWMIAASTLRSLARLAGLAAPVLLLGALDPAPLALAATEAALAGDLGLARTLALALLGVVLSLDLLATAIDWRPSWSER